jgi:4-hydroxymandelate oxidase
LPPHNQLVYFTRPRAGAGGDFEFVTHGIGESVLASKKKSAATPQAPGKPEEALKPSAERQLLNLADYEGLARERMQPAAWEYVSGAAADEITLRWNREAFDRVELMPRVLMDVSKLDTRVTLFHQELPFPILLAPTGFQRLVHPEGEVAVARGAGAAKAVLVMSSAATTSVEEVAKAATGPLWFQLYVQRDRGFTRELVARAEQAGAKALVLTVDMPVIGARNREARSGFCLPPGMELPNLKGSYGKENATPHRSMGDGIYSEALDPTLTWKDLDWLLGVAKAPVLLKGILAPGDAERAAGAGVAGIIVSNHGGRNLDTAAATLDVLPQVVKRVGEQLPVLVDGGIRRGTDVLKALALGARAVLIGRPYLYGLGVAGAEGVTRVLNILRQEFEMAMALTGRTRLREIDRSLLWRSAPVEE